MSRTRTAFVASLLLSHHYQVLGRLGASGNGANGGKPGGARDDQGRGAEPFIRPSRVPQRLCRSGRCRQAGRSRIGGLLPRLDPHSKYLNPDKYAETRRRRRRVGRVGVEEAVENGLVKVLNPIENFTRLRRCAAGRFFHPHQRRTGTGVTLVEAMERMRGSIERR